MDKEKEAVADEILAAALENRPSNVPEDYPDKAKLEESAKKLAEAFKLFMAGNLAVDKEADKLIAMINDDNVGMSDFAELPPVNGLVVLRAMSKVGKYEADNAQKKMDWRYHARLADVQIRNDYPYLKVDDRAEKVAEILKLQGVRGRGGKTLTAATIKRDCPLRA